MKNITTKWYSIISGTVFLLIILIVLLFIPCPTNPQLNFLRIFLAIAGGAFAATIPGSIKVTNYLVTTTRSIGVFVILYFVNPVGWTSGDCNLKNFKATVYIDNTLTEGVEITIPSIGQKFLTNEFGSVNIEYATEQLRLPSQFIFKYKSKIDTVITINEIVNNKIDFNFKANKKGATQINTNSINYTLNDINLNISLLNQIGRDGLSKEADYLTYSFQNIGDTIIIEPNSKILNQIKSNQITDGRTLDNVDGIYDLELNLPQFDLKFTNNSSDALFLNQIGLTVVQSIPNNEALFITGNSWDFSLYNFGWGDAKNVKLDFSTTPATQQPNWKKPFEDHIEYSTLKAGSNTSVLENVIKNLAKKGVNPRCFVNDETALYFDPNDPRERIEGKKIAGEFVDGAVIYGTITYSDEMHSKKIQKFKSYIDVMREGYGAAADISANYNTEFRNKGKNYSLNIPISNSIKPKDFDRISLTFGSKQSSVHYFKMTFYYNDKKIVLPYIFKLDYFISYDRSNKLANQKNNITF